MSIPLFFSKLSLERYGGVFIAKMPGARYYFQKSETGNITVLLGFIKWSNRYKIINPIKSIQGIDIIKVIVLPRMDAPLVTGSELR